MILKYYRNDVGMFAGFAGEKRYSENNEFFVAVGSQTYKVLKTL